MLILFLLLTGCIRSSNSKTLEADNITIGLSFSSYIMFGADQGVVDNLLSQFNSLGFEKTAEQIDLLTALHVSFSYKGKGVKSFWVDKKGVFWLNGTTECFKASSGYLDYQYIKAVYEDSQNNSARQGTKGRVGGNTYEL